MVNSPENRVLFSLTRTQAGIIIGAVVLGIFITVGTPVLAVRDQFRNQSDSLAEVRQDFRDLNTRFERYREEQDQKMNAVLSGVIEIRVNVAKASTEIAGVHDWIRGNTTVGTGR